MAYYRIVFKFMYTDPFCNCIKDRCRYYGRHSKASNEKCEVNDTNTDTL